VTMAVDEQHLRSGGTDLLRILRIVLQTFEDPD
jgi:hypothetical protein